MSESLGVVGIDESPAVPLPREAILALEALKFANSTGLHGVPAALVTDASLSIEARLTGVLLLVLDPMITGKAHPFLARLARTLGTNVPSVKASLAELGAAGWLLRSERAVRRAGKS